jgi:hypothetical protein
MVEAALQRLGDLLEAETSSACAVEKAFRAMASSAPVAARPLERPTTRERSD